nr:reverse transcriptase domain-containing protein [Tanacetum cinerariifolium]
MRLQKITTLFRFIEMFLFLVMISRFSSQLPFAVKVSSYYYFKGISLTMLSPKFVFVIGNMIILILFLKSRSLEKEENDDACYEYVKTCDMNVVNCSKVVASKPKISRSRSDNRIVKSKDDQTRKELRRSVTDISKSTTMTVQKRIVKEELSSDDFRRTVEAFIERQQKILRDEEFSPMVDTESFYLSSRSRETKFASEKCHNKRASSRRTKALSKSKGNAGGHWKSKPKRQKSSVEDDLSQPWVCEETDPFTPRIRYFDFLKTRMPSHIKTYDESEDPEDHLKIFQATAKKEQSIDSYDDLKKAFLENYLQQKKCIKDPIEIHNIKHRDEESTEEFVWRYKLKCRDVKGAPECLKISGFMHGITNLELIKRLHDKILKSVDEMMRVTTTFLRGVVAASNRERKKSLSSWKQQEVGQKPNFKKGGFRIQQRLERKQDKQIEKMLKVGKLSHLIKKLKQINGKDQAKVAKKGETPRKKKTASNTDVEEDGTEGPMIIEAEMGGHFVHRMYVDGGSSSEILMDEFDGCKVTISIQRNIREARSKENPGSTVYSSQNAKFPVAGGTVTLRSSRIIPLECTMVSGPGIPQLVINQVTKEKIQVAIHPEYPKQTIAIGSTLTKEGRKELYGLLRRNLDIFAWKPADMTGVPRHIAEHRLNIREGFLPGRQKKRGQALERNKAIYEEVEKLVEASIIKEVHYHIWLSNLVMMKKHDGSWRMCVDFKDLNKACPKDGYSLPEID